MESVFITELIIEKVRHLENICISIAENERKHLILTGKNGSGKTSVLDAMAVYLEGLTSIFEPTGQLLRLNTYASRLNKIPENEIAFSDDEIEEFSKSGMQEGLSLLLRFNMSLSETHTAFVNNKFVTAYYKDHRVFETELPRHVSKVQLLDRYSIQEKPGRDFGKYLLDLRMTEALAAAGGKMEKAEQINAWFAQFQDMLRTVFEDKSLTLEFEEETFSFTIHQDGREPYTLNELSSGYGAILDIIVDIMLRMEKQTGRTFHYDMPGIVLIDEIETHLHLELQKNIMNILTSIFPNIQFIVSTHSPFILNSLEDVVIYDLENHTCVNHGLTDVPYEGIVEGYFHTDTMSDLLKEKFERYRELTKHEQLSDAEYEEIAKLELFLDEIPDYLALDIATEYKKLKLDFESREDYA